jgi:hypothetical protein
MQASPSRSVHHALEVPVAAREQILRVLGMASRPLRWAELQGALGLLTNEARSACEWLMDHGYIAPMAFVKGAASSVEALWTLGDKGREWAREHGALSPGAA